ncbi:hypothetical protein [Enterobacter sp. UCD-UG_FMILLET]|uniref:hypothetical protein n=1 Tax=Enterobacter sp. UCD-UG_FMILLET TaxID=1542468 RepID=UPI00190F9CBB|nr:hypothetical protein [Enterobacter sp. UCD-UG_FMILLET]
MPRTKLFDVVVNDPDKVRASAGKTALLQIRQLTGLTIGNEVGTPPYVFQQTDIPSINVFFGPTQPAAFFSAAELITCTAAPAC